MSRMLSLAGRLVQKRPTLTVRRRLAHLSGRVCGSSSKRAGRQRLLSPRRAHSPRPMLRCLARLPLLLQLLALAPLPLSLRLRR